MDRYRDPAAFKRWSDLLQARDRIPSDDQAAQNHLGKLEHAAYAESQVRENPLTGPLQMAILTPGYTAAKALGLRRGRSEPSLEEIAAGLRSVGRGYTANIGDALSMAAGDPQPIAKQPVVQPMSQRLSEQELAAFLLRNR